MNSLDSVCRIALNYRSGNDSLVDVVADSGFAECRDNLSPDDLAPILRADSSLVDSWFAYSEDKRTSGGFYIVERGGQFVVGLIGGAESQFAERAEACAHFVCLEIKAVGSS